jgi:hypothetical protein
MYVFYNANYCDLFTGDCVIRAICKAENMDWHDVYDDLSVQGRMMCAWGDTNAVWGAYLESIGYSLSIIDRSLVGRYTVKDFIEDHPYSTYIVATGSHVVCIKQGVAYDTWNSLGEQVAYYFYRR